MDTILVANAGSSSVKFQLFEVSQEGELKSLVDGQLDGIGTAPKLKAKGAGGAAAQVERTFTTKEVPDVSAALQRCASWLRDEVKVAPAAIGHRVVHGGPHYDAPVLVDEAVLRRLEAYAPLAPLHQPFNLAPIRTLLRNNPKLPQVACFDTAFHRQHGALADHYALPQHLYEEGVRRYGFHGLSYEHVAGRLQEIDPKRGSGKVIVAHLGSGASMCAMENGRSIESTLGFTALDGLPMGTRCGQLDPGVVLYLIAEKGMSASAVQDLLYRDCGLKALSGISNDMRALERSDAPRAAFAIDYFTYRIALFAGMLAAALKGIDAFVFTAGIGENSALVRAKTMERLSWLGVKLDPAANKANADLISVPDSAFPVFVIHTDEQVMIARHTAKLVFGGVDTTSGDPKQKSHEATVA